MGLGRKAHACEAIDEEDVKRLKESGELGSDTPHSLQFSLFYNFSRGFGLRGRQDHKLMKLGDIERKRTSDNVRYLELKERNSKTMDGSKKDDFRRTKQIIYSTGEVNDPVELFDKFISKRPLESLTDESPLYLTPIPVKRIKNNECWYYNTPMGHNMLGNLVKNACARAGVEGKKTNHHIKSFE